MFRFASVGVAVLLFLVPLGAQWPARPPANAPLTSDGSMDLDAPSPRTHDGKPDLSGTWRPGGSSFASGRGFSFPPPGVSEIRGMWVVPFAGVARTDYGERLFMARQATDSKDNPRGLCLPMGIMQLHTSAGYARYIQTPGELVILYEMNGERREIFTDGRPLPTNDPQPWWNGYSVGRWEGDVLVVETAHFRDAGWLDMAGNVLSDAARVSERFRRTAYGRMEIDITIDDRKSYLSPIMVRWNLGLAPDTNLIEFVCAENNRFGRKVAP